MGFFQQIMVNVLAKEEVSVTFPNLKFKVSDLMEMPCFDALQKIKFIVENDSLSDFECVERITRILEEMGSDAGNRHDFG